MNTGNNRHYRKRSFQKYFFRNTNSPLYSYKYKEINFNNINVGNIISNNNKKKFNNTGTQENKNDNHLSLNDENDLEFTNGQEKKEDDFISYLKNNTPIEDDFYIKLFENVFFVENSRSINLYKKIINNNQLDINITPLMKECYNNIYKELGVPDNNIKGSFKNVDKVTFNEPQFFSDIVLFKINKDNQFSLLTTKNIIRDNICVQLDCYTLLIFSNSKRYKKINNKIILNNINNFILNNFSDFIISVKKNMFFPAQKKDKKIDKKVADFYKSIFIDKKSK